MYDFSLTCKQGIEKKMYAQQAVEIVLYYINYITLY